MMKKRGVPSATKANLDEAVVSLHRDLDSKATKANLDEAVVSLRRDLESKATKDDLSDLGKAIRAEMATKADLKEEIGSARRDLGLAIIETHKRIDHLEEGLRAEIREGNSRVIQAIDTFSSKVRNCENGMLFNGQGLTNVQDGLREHERRIAALEARPGS